MLERPKREGRRRGAVVGLKILGSFRIGVRREGERVTAIFTGTVSRRFYSH